MIKGRITRKELRKWNKEDLIALALLRNDDAKDYAREITKLNKELEKLRNR